MATKEEKIEVTATEESTEVVNNLAEAPVEDATANIAAEQAPVYTADANKKSSHPSAKNAKIAAGHAVGRRKSAIARVRLVPGNGKWTINGKELEAYLPNKVHQQLVNSPFDTVEQIGKYDVLVNVRGGGVSGQAGAIRLGVSRALNEIDRETNRPVLKAEGFLKRDARVVERKKAGLKKARKASQFSKR